MLITPYICIISDASFDVFTLSPCAIRCIQMRIQSPPPPPPPTMDSPRTQIKSIYRMVPRRALTLEVRLLGWTWIQIRPKKKTCSFCPSVEMMHLGSQYDKTSNDTCRCSLLHLNNIFVPACLSIFLSSTRSEK